MKKSKILISLILTQILFVFLIFIVNDKISIVEAKKDKGININFLNLRLFLNKLTI